MSIQHQLPDFIRQQDNLTPEWLDQTLKEQERTAWLAWKDWWLASGLSLDMGFFVVTQGLRDQGFIISDERAGEHMEYWSDQYHLFMSQEANQFFQAETRHNRRSREDLVAPLILWYFMRFLIPKPYHA